MIKKITCQKVAELRGKRSEINAKIKKLLADQKELDASNRAIDPYGEHLLHLVPKELLVLRFGQLRRVKFLISLDHPETSRAKLGDT